MTTSSSYSRFFNSKNVMKLCVFLYINCLEPSPIFLNFKTDFAEIHTIRSPSFQRFTLKYMYFQFQYMSEIQWNFEGSLECRKPFLSSLLRLERTLTSIARTPFCSNCVSMVPCFDCTPIHNLCVMYPPQPMVYLTLKLTACRGRSKNLC